MERFYYERPSLKRKDEIKEYLDEFIKYGSNINGVGGMDQIYKGLTIEEAIERCNNTEDEEFAKSIGKCPGKTFLLIREDDNKIIGTLNLRWNLNEEMLKTGGHIGYGIRPTERRKGYNKINLYLGLLEAKKLYLDKVMLSCHITNIGSNKTIKALSGIFERNDTYKDGKEINIYWINVDDSIKKYEDIYKEYIKR